MDRIAYRIYDPIEKKFIFSGSTPTMLSAFFKHTATLDTVHEMKYQQFTGLSDKQGVEIYEGDIVKGQFYNDDNKYESVKGQVVFSYGVFELEWGNGSHYKLFGIYYKLIGISCLEIIGNIYENKDLLK